MAVQAQNKKARVWVLLFLCLTGGYALGLLNDFIDPAKQLVPMVLIAIVVAPIALIAQAISKYGEIKKVKGLSREEQRRLDEAVNTQRSALFYYLFFFLLSTTGVAIGFYAATLKISFNANLWALRATGFIAVFATVISFKIYRDLAKVQDYEAIVTRRSEERKAKAAALKKLSEDSPNSKG